MRISFYKLAASTLSFAAILPAAKAQGLIDVGTFAQTSSYATARSVGFGGALGSVGGDFASLSVNPAGIGIYRSSEFMFTPGLRFSGANSNYTGVSTKDNNVRFGLNNIGMVYAEAATGKEYERSDWKSFGFGVGVNRTADFSRTYDYKGQSTTSSASQYFEGDALVYPSSTTNDPNTPAYLGYQSYLLGPGPNYTSYVPYASGINQRRTVQEKGGISEVALSFGGNYREKLLLGATLGIPVLRHKVSSTMYEETIDPSTSNDFDHFSYTESYTTTGSGVNLKLGAIYKFNPYFRAGLAFHTPSYYSLTETSDNSINTSSLNYGNQQVISDPNQFNYRISTPFKTVLSATGILGKHGFVSVDYEYVNYATMRVHFDDKVAQNNFNSTLKNLYGSASNIRAGLELKFDQLLLRTGFGYYSSPYKDTYYQSERINLSFGVGYRFGRTFVDFGLVNSAYTTQEQPYVLDGSLGFSQPSSASIKNNLTSGVLTLGWKF